LKETKFLTGRIGRYEPLDLDGYRSLGGLEALRQALAVSAEEVIEQVKQSKLTGRGGAGFSTGLKWAFAAQQQQSQKYFICNAEEGELGTFKDKLLLDGDPWAVLEGILIASYSTGAQKAYIFISSKYEDSLMLWEKLIAAAKEAALLGSNILGAGFNLELQAVKAPAMYITGEESALINTLGMHRPMSRPRPPYPAQKGLFEKPTVVNNVETLANIPLIIKDGVGSFLRLGTADEPGTRLVSLSGDVNKSGVYEIEIGSETITELIEHFGGGTAAGRPIKAVQPGGGTSRLLDNNSLGCRLSSKDIEKAGSNLGTAGVIVYEEPKSAVDIVKGLMDFYSRQSCGYCVPCRIGVVRVKQIIDRISQGRGTKDDLEDLEQICRTAVSASACGMGQSFGLPVLSGMKLFPEDFRQLLNKKTG